MLELKRSQAWDSPMVNLVPTKDLTPNEIRRLAAREALIDAAVEEAKKPWVYLKVNHGIFRGTIFRVDNRGDTKIRVEVDHYAKRMAKEAVNYTPYRGAPKSHNPYLVDYHLRNHDKSRDWSFADRMVSFSFGFDWQKPFTLKFSEMWINPGFWSSDVIGGVSLLIDYQGPEVFSFNESRRSLVFRDRLDQDVTVGDLVVVALNNGQGLDVCLVRGFADEDRVYIESVETVVPDRITLENDRTPKIMRMPNSLKDTALMIKLAR